MPGKYGYWRKPNTRVDRRRSPRYAPTNVLKLLGENAQVDGDGVVSWRVGMSYLTYSRMLVDTIAIRQPDKRYLNEHDAEVLVEEALRDVVKAEGDRKAITPAAFMKAIDARAEEFFKRPAIPYVVVTGLAVRDFPSIDEMIFGVRFTTDQRSEYDPPETEYCVDGALGVHLETSAYQCISLHSEEISGAQAFERCVRAINAFRGLLTLMGTYRARQWHNFGVPSRTMLATVALSPVHSVHVQGHRACIGSWFEPDHVEDSALYCPHEGWDAGLAKARELISKIDSLPYSKAYVDLLSRYATAFDQTNVDVAFLMLWSLLEAITDTVGGGHEATVRRAIWPIADREIARHLMQQARLRRNLFVHSASSRGDRRNLLETIKATVDLHLAWLLQNKCEVPSLKRYAEILNLPVRREDLEFIRERANRVIQVRWPGS